MVSVNYTSEFLEQDALEFEEPEFFNPESIEPEFTGPESFYLPRVPYRQWFLFREGLLLVGGVSLFLGSMLWTVAHLVPMKPTYLAKNKHTQPAPKLIKSRRIALQK